MKKVKKTKFTKENVLKLLSLKENGINNDCGINSAEYKEGYTDAIKELRYIFTVVWED